MRKSFFINGSFNSFGVSLFISSMSVAKLKFGFNWLCSEAAERVQ